MVALPATANAICSPYTIYGLPQFFICPISPRCKLLLKEVPLEKADGFVFAERWLYLGRVQPFNEGREYLIDCSPARFSRCSVVLVQIV